MQRIDEVNGLASHMLNVLCFYRDTQTHTHALFLVNSRARGDQLLCPWVWMAGVMSGSLSIRALKSFSLFPCFLLPPRVSPFHVFFCMLLMNCIVTISLSAVTKVFWPLCATKSKRTAVFVFRKVFKLHHMSWTLRMDKRSFSSFFFVFLLLPHFSF